jgi:16S rRNA (guanine966-N2)-methyltransferase
VSRNRPGRASRGGGRLRIIAGHYRGRILPVPDAPGLRPTGDRVRETVFSWLAPVIAGARCLDAFAGSGALGLEAASRGAGSVTLIERSERVARQLQTNVRTLEARNVEVIRADALRWLSSNTTAAPFDLVFLDPPFDDDLLGPACRLLDTGGKLSSSAHIYLELPAHRDHPALPSAWEVLRERTAGAVRFMLARCGSNA